MKWPQFSSSGHRNQSALLCSLRMSWFAAGCHMEGTHSISRWHPTCWGVSYKSDLYSACSSTMLHNILLIQKINNYGTAVQCVVLLWKCDVVTFAKLLIWQAKMIQYFDFFFVFSTNYFVLTRPKAVRGDMQPWHEKQFIKMYPKSHVRLNNIKGNFRISFCVPWIHWTNSASNKKVIL